MSRSVQKQPSAAHVITYGEWQKEMACIADLAARAGVVAPAPPSSAPAAPSSTLFPQGPSPSALSAASALPVPSTTATPALVAPSWDRLLSFLHQYPYGAESEHAHGTQNDSSTARVGAADALFHALERVDRVLFLISQENRVADLASSHTADAQTFMYRALLHRHAYLLFQQQMDAVMAYEKAVEGQTPAATPLVDTYPGLIAQVAALYTPGRHAIGADVGSHSDPRAVESSSAATAAAMAQPWPSSAPPSSCTGGAATNHTANRVVKPSRHVLPSSSATASAALAQYQLLTAGSTATANGIVADVPHSHTHAAWFAQMQQRQIHFLHSEARDYQRAARLWRRVELERVRLGVPSQDEALAMSVLCTTMGCGVLLRAQTSERHNPYSRWQYEHAAFNTPDAAEKKNNNNTSDDTEPRCVRCGGALPVAAPLYLGTISGMLLDLAQSLERELACTEQAVNYYELAATVVLRAVPSWWTLRRALATEQAVSEALRDWEATQPSESRATPRTGPSVVATALNGADAASWWGGLVSHLASTFTREGSATAESEEARQARRAREQRVREVRAELEVKWRAQHPNGDAAAVDGYPVYSGHWSSFEAAMNGAMRCAAQCQEYALALRYTHVFLTALSTYTASITARSAGSRERLCVCTSAVWRRRTEVAATTGAPVPPPSHNTDQGEEDKDNAKDEREEVLAAFNTVRVSCLVRRVLIHLLLHDERPSMSSTNAADAPHGDQACAQTDVGSTSVWVKRAKTQAREAAASMVPDVHLSLCTLVDIVEAAHGAASDLVGAALAENAWQHSYLYPDSSTARPQAAAHVQATVKEAPPERFPAMGSSQPCARRPSGALDYRQSAAYAVVKARACASHAPTESAADDNKTAPAACSREQVLVQSTDPRPRTVDVKDALWAVLASLVALADVTSGTFTAPLQRQPLRLAPWHASVEAEEEPSSPPPSRRAEPFHVRRRVEAELTRLGKALWTLGVSDECFGALQQRLRTKLFFPAALQV